MAKLSSKYPYEAKTTRAVTLMPDNVALPKNHAVIVTSETENFGRVVTEVNGNPFSGFLAQDEYEKV